MNEHTKTGLQIALEALNGNFNIVLGLSNDDKMRLTLLISEELNPGAGIAGGEIPLIKRRPTDPFETIFKYDELNEGQGIMEQLEDLTIKPEPKDPEVQKREDEFMKTMFPKT